MLTFEKMKQAALKLDSSRELSLDDWKIIAPINQMFFLQKGRYMDHDAHGVYRPDMNESLALLRSLTEWMNETYNIVIQAKLRFMVVAPIRPRSDSGARRIGWFVSETLGKMKILARGARDLPELTADLKERWIDIELGGAQVTLLWEDIEAAIYMGRPLPFEPAAMGRRAADNLLEDITFKGDKQSGLEGMISNPSKMSTITGVVWSGLTAQQKVDFLKSLLNNSSSLFGYNLLSDTLLVPGYVKQDIEQTDYGQSSQYTTIDDYIKLIYKEQNLKIYDWEKLKGVKVTGINNKDVAMAYPFSFEVLENMIINPFFAKPMKTDENDDVTQRFYTKTGGIAKRQPKTMTWATLN